MRTELRSINIRKRLRLEMLAYLIWPYREIVKDRQKSSLFSIFSLSRKFSITLNSCFNFACIFASRHRSVENAGPSRLILAICSKSPLPNFSSVRAATSMKYRMLLFVLLAYLSHSMTNVGYQRVTVTCRDDQSCRGRGLATAVPLRSQYQSLSEDL